MRTALDILLRRVEVALYVVGIFFAVLMVGIGTIVCLCTFRIKKP